MNPCWSFDHATTSSLLSEAIWGDHTKTIFPIFFSQRRPAAAEASPACRSAHHPEPSLVCWNPATAGSSQSHFSDAPGCTRSCTLRRQEKRANFSQLHNLDRLNIYQKKTTISNNIKWHHNVAVLFAWLTTVYSQYIVGISWSFHVGPFLAWQNMLAWTYCTLISHVFVFLSATLHSIYKYLIDWGSVRTIVLYQFFNLEIYHE